MMDALTRHFVLYRERGDVESLGAVFDAAAGRLASLAQLLCGGLNDAEDLVQATFLVAIRKAGDFDSARPLMPWLCGLLEGEARNLRRRHQRTRATELPDLLTADTGPLDASERTELVAVLRRHVDRLPVEQRQVLLLQLQHGLRAVEVAELLGLAPGTVRMRIHRGLEALRRWLPASLGACLATALPLRGMASVRAEVLAAGTLARTTLAIGGGLLMKKILTLAIAFALAALGWWGWSEPRPGGDRATAGPTSSVPATGTLVRVEPTATSAHADDAAAERLLVVAAAPANARAATTGSLLLRVFSYEQHEPMPHATAIITPIGGGDPAFGRRTVTADRRGEVRIDDLDAGEFDVRVQCGGHWRATITPGAETVVDADIMVGNAVRGCVVLPDGKAAAGAAIVLSSDGDVFHGCDADAAGQFELAAVYPFHRIGARLPGYAPSALHALDSDRVLRIVLPGPAAVIEGIVADAAGRAIAGARVFTTCEAPPEQWLDADGETLWRGGEQEVATGADGTFRLEVGLGRHRLRALARDAASAEALVDAVPGAIAPVRITLSRSEHLAGVVVDADGVPVNAVEVRLGGRHGPLQTTGEDGAFAFAAAPAGTRVAWCLSPSIEPLRAVRSDGASGPWRIAVRRRPLWPLRLVDERGEPMAHCFVVCTAPVELRESAYTDADGCATVCTPCDQRGRLSVSQHKFDRVQVDWPADADPSRLTTIVVPDAKRQNAVVRGRLTDERGAPVPDVELTLRTAGSDEPVVLAMAGAIRSAAMMLGDDADAVPPAEPGAFAFRVREGDAQLFAAREGLPDVVFAVSGLRAGEVRDLGTLHLPAQGSLTVSLTMPGGAVPQDVQIEVVDEHDRQASCIWHGDGERAWPAGAFRYRITCSNAVWRTGVFRVRAGEATRLALELTPGTPQTLIAPPPMSATSGDAHAGRATWTLSSPDGAICAFGTWNPYDEGALELEPPLLPGHWSFGVEFADGECWVGSVDFDGIARAAAVPVVWSAAR